MKRLISGLILTLSVFSLLGCSMNSDEGGNESTNKNVTETEVETSSEPVEETGGEDSISETNRSSNESSIDPVDAILFVPQKSDLESGFTVENDSALQQLEQLILNEEVENIGVEDDVAIQFTGLYLEGENTTDAILIIVNKTEMTMTNMSFKMSLGTSSGEMVLEDHEIGLTEDVFGVLEPNTAMPLYVTIDQGKKELLLQLVRERQEIISLDDFQFQEIDSESQSVSLKKSLTTLTNQENE